MSQARRKARELIYWKVIIGREDKTQWDRFSLCVCLSLTLSLFLSNEAISFICATHFLRSWLKLKTRLLKHTHCARSFANANAVNMEKFIEGFFFFLSQTWAHKRTISEILHLKRKTKQKITEHIMNVQKLSTNWNAMSFKLFSQREREKERKRNRIFH